MSEAKLNIGHKVKALRELKGFSQEYLSGKIDVSQTALSKIEKGEIKISFEKACQIANILETDINTLINFEPHNFFNNCQQFGVINTTFQIDKNLIEELLKAKDDIIEEKEKFIQLLLQNK